MDRVLVDGVEIAPRTIAAEMQYHPAPSRERAWEAAATALVIRALLLQEATRLGVTAESENDENAGEALIQALLAREIDIPEPDEAICRRYWAANRAKFRSPDLYEAAHILFPAPPDDKPAREAAKLAALKSLELLKQDPRRFATLAKERSACASGTAGGILGQQTRGDLVPEFETFILSLEEGQLCPVPVPTRYGFHVLRLDRLVRGKELPFEAVASQIAKYLSSHSWQRAVGQYLRLLAGRATISGLEIDRAESPLVQ
jgi:peptidyl-prolyl cis-trans isomerase C